MSRPTLRELVTSPFGLAILAEADKHGGVDEYAAKLRASGQTVESWMTGKRNPGKLLARRLVKLSPDLRPHLVERGCFRGPSPVVPLSSGGQTSDAAAREHAEALADAALRAAKLKRGEEIRRLARARAARLRRPGKAWTPEQMDYLAGVRSRRRGGDAVDDVAVSGDVLPRDTYTMEDS